MNVLSLKAEDMSNTQTSWTVIVEEDPATGDLILPLPKELLKSLGWIEGDDLDWSDNNDGTFTVVKVTK